jgi:hypothetical protein
MIAKEKDVLVDLLQKQEGRQVQSRFLCSTARDRDADQKGRGTAPPRYARSEPAPEKVGDTPT